MNNIQVLLPPGTNPQPYVAWPDFQRNSILVRTVGVSSYDSMQMKFQRRWHQGLAFLLAYTLSEAKTNAGDSLSGGLVGEPARAGSGRLQPRKGHPPGGLPHTALAGVQRQLRSAGKGILLGGWRANWVLMLYSGQPQTVNCAVTNCGADRRRHELRCAARRRSVRGRGHGREHATTRRRSPHRRPVTSIGQTDFSPLGGEGTQVTGPGLTQLDFGLAKSFNVWGQRRVEFRVETFNLTNTPAFELPPNSTLDYRDARNFAAVNRMRNTPRQLQLGLKFYW